MLSTHTFGVDDFSGEWRQLVTACMSLILKQYCVNDKRTVKRVGCTIATGSTLN